MIKKKDNDLHALLKRGRWYSGLDRETQARIEAAGQIRQVRRGETFIKQGADASGLYGLIEGQVRAQCMASNGKVALIAVYHPSDFFSFISCADDRTHSMDHIASVESSIFVLPIAGVREIFASNQKLFLYLVDPPLISMRRVIEYMTSTIRLSPLQRLAERLLDLSRSPYYPDGEHRPILGLSQELLASAVLCTRQTTNELLRQLQSRGLIKSEYGRIDILDADGLRKIFQPR